MSYDDAFKLKVVSCAEQSTNRGAARKFGVDELIDAALEQSPPWNSRLRYMQNEIISRCGD